MLGSDASFFGVCGVEPEHFAPSYGDAGLLPGSSHEVAGLSASGLPAEVVPQVQVLEDGPVGICAQPPPPTAKVVSANGQYALIASRGKCQFRATL